MKIAAKLGFQAFLAASLAMFLAGCAMHPKERMSSNTTDYNLVVEKVQNEMLLLNIVRASKRRPMYFTGFNLLRGSMSYNFSTGDITIPFGRIGAGLDGSYSIAPSVSYSDNPSFDLVVWDTKEFTTGIMTPVSMEAVYYYLEKLGWPKEMLLHLLVERIEIHKDGNLLATYVNDPETEKKFDEFQSKLRELLPCKLVRMETYEPIGPRLQEESLGDLKQLIEAHKAGLAIHRVRDGDQEWYQLSSKKNDYYYRCTDVEQSEVKTYRISDEKNNHPNKNDDNPDYRFLLRSPEGILYYLGEILRVEMEKNYVPMIEVCESYPHVPLFVVNKEIEKNRSPIVMAEYEGTKYIIPGASETDSKNSCYEDRSMHVLTFVSQLIAEQKAGLNVPVTGAVTSVGR